MPAISANLRAFEIEFENSFDLAFQQMESTLRGAVQSGPGKGERMRGQILESDEVTEYNERGGDTVYTDLDADVWNVFPQPAEIAHIQDEWDDEYLGDTVRPDSELVQTQAAAVNRQIDNKIVRAMTGPAYRGKQGTTSTNFDTTNQRVAVDYQGPNGTTANTGLNYHKIARAARILDDNEVPQGDRFLSIRAAQMEDLVSDIIDNHSDELASIKGLTATNRVITEILGFRVIQTQRVLVADTVTSAGTDVASNIAWHKSAVKLRIWGDRRTHMDILPERRHALAIRTTVNVGATRARDEAVVEILSDQSP